MEDVEIRYVIPAATNSEHIRFCHLHTNYYGADEVVVQWVMHFCQTRT
jgi:hypothetical protein